MTDVSNEDTQKISREQLEEIKKNCIFCKIISGEIPSKKVFEDKKFFAILDINPANEGHILLMPKQHVQIMPDLDSESIAEIGVVSKELSAKLLKAYGVQGTSVFIANGFVAGQKSPHFIVHIIPRKEGDDVSLNPALINIEQKKFDSIKNKIMQRMGIRSSSETNPSSSVVENKTNNKNGASAKLSKEQDREDALKPETNPKIRNKKKVITKADLDKISKLFN